MTVSHGTQPPVFRAGPLGCGPSAAGGGTGMGVGGSVVPGEGGQADIRLCPSPCSSARPWPRV